MRRRWAATWFAVALSAGACGEKLDAVQTGEDLGITGPVTYDAHIAPLLARCTGCHGADGATAGVRLDSFANARANADLADEMIQSGQMPPSGGLAQRDRDLFSRWIVDGLLETAPAAAEVTP